MRRLLRALLVLLVLAILLGAAGVVAEWLLRREVAARVQAQVEQALTEATDDGAGFATVRTEVEGYALPALVGGRLDTVRVRAQDGVVRGIPVDVLEIDATGVATDGTTAERFDVRVTADAAGAVATLVDQEVAETTRAVADDRMEVTAPVELPLLEAPLELTVQVQVTVVDGGLLVEPVSVSAAGLDVDVSTFDQLPRGRVTADDLPPGLHITDVRVEGGDNPVLRLTGECEGGCSLQVPAR